MAPIVTPYIPFRITVHLDKPDVYAENVTVSFSDYVKNVASSEVYPTWGESALRANILAITSFALNRVYTEFYRSRGYAFDITASTAYDQKFIYGRTIFTPISRLVDELYDDYLRRPGFLEPLAAQFCDGHTVTCDGLSQWGSEELSQQGYSANQILRFYYGDVEIVRNARQQNIESSYPGTPLRQGDRGQDVRTLQISLNRIRRSLPAIPVLDEDGIFGPKTKAAVQNFQRAFNLTQDGIVGRATWNYIVRVYVAVLRLSELDSLGQRIFVGRTLGDGEALQQGERGDKVLQLQYMLSYLSSFLPEVPSLRPDAIFGPATQASVEGFQRFASLPVTGVVTERDWDAMYEEYAGASRTVALLEEARS